MNSHICIVKTEGENIVVKFIHLKHINKSKLADKLGMSGQNLHARLEKSSLSTDFIEQCSDALEHNFFEDLSKEYKRKHFKADNVVEEPVVKYGGGSLDALIEQIVERKVASRKYKPEGEFKKNVQMDCPFVLKAKTCSVYAGLRVDKV